MKKYRILFKTNIGNSFGSIQSGLNEIGASFSEYYNSDNCNIRLRYKSGPVNPFGPLNHVVSDYSPSKTDMDIYPCGEISEYILNQNSLYGVQFRVENPFGGCEVFFPKGGDSVKLSLYKWESNYSITVSKAPVAQKNATDIKNGQWVKIEYMGSGEFLLVLSHGSDGMTLGIVEKPSDKANNYVHTSLSDVSVVCRTLKKCVFLKPSEPTPQDFISDDSAFWVGTDGLGRTFPTSEEAPKPRNEKYVGLFYHTWHSAFAYRDLLNVTETLKNNPDANRDFNHPAWGGKTNCFWNEPLFGYYNNGVDRYVLRKHAELLANAGIDVVFFDNTNFTLNFMDAIFALCEVWAEARADGVKTPRISAMLNMYEYNDTATQIMELYGKLYSKGLYKDLWFYWEGKPLLLACPEELKKLENGNDAFEFFTFRPINPSYTEEQELTRESDVSTRITFVPSKECSKYTMWKWISVYPQEKMYKKGTDEVEEMCVCVAQNWSEKQGLTPMNAGDMVFGRGYTNKYGANTSDDAAMLGLNIAEQWEYAINVDPKLIYITGWNEWQVGRYEEMWGFKNVFPDNATDKYSRDIEPSKGMLKDHFYNQMVSYIRKFKGMSVQQTSSGAVENAGETGENINWESVTPKYRDYKGNTPLRNYDGYDEYHYENATMRNDFVEAKVAYDSDNLYFYAETADKITEYTDPSWMRLFIDADDKNNGWETFDYVVNRLTPTETEGILERSKGGWNWEKVCNVKYTARGNKIVIVVPKSALNIKNESFKLNFKWSDNMQTEGDIMDFYVNGNAAPGGRFKYTFEVE